MNAAWVAEAGLISKLTVPMEPAFLIPLCQGCWAAFEQEWTMCREEHCSLLSSQPSFSLPSVISAAFASWPYHIVLLCRLLKKKYIYIIKNTSTRAAKNAAFKASYLMIVQWSLLHMWYVRFNSKLWMLLLYYTDWLLLNMLKLVTWLKKGIRGPKIWEDWLGTGHIKAPKPSSFRVLDDIFSLAG